MAENDFPQDTNPYPNDTLNLLAAKIARILKDGAGGGGGGGLTDAQLRATPVPVASAQGGGALTDRSGTVTAGGTSQQIAAANASRKCFFYQNTSDETQYLNFGAAASAANSIEIASKGYWENPPNFCPTGTVNMLGATTAKSFTAKEG